MPCTPLSVTLEVDPDPKQKICFGLNKICNNDNTVQWTMHFQLQQGNPLATVVQLDVAITKEYHAQAEATALHGLDESQRGQALVAAAIATDPGCTPADRAQAAQDVIAARAMQAGA